MKTAANTTNITPFSAPSFTINGHVCGMTPVGNIDCSVIERVYMPDTDVLLKYQEDHQNGIIPNSFFIGTEDEVDLLYQSLIDNASQQKPNLEAFLASEYPKEDLFKL